MQVYNFLKSWHYGLHFKVKTHPNDVKQNIALETVCWSKNTKQENNIIENRE